jgi:predicted metal-binding membrane protein
MRTALAALREMAIGPAWPIVLLSALAWSFVIASDNALLVPSLCAAHWTVGTSSFVVAVATNLTPAQMLFWLAMLLAMMPPLLWLSLTHVWHRSLAERRSRAVLLFLAGYLGLWLPATVVLAGAAIALRLATGSTLAAIAIAVAGAVLWQTAPVRAQCLRRCHDLEPLPAFGLAADWASLRFGARIGVFCIGACWALMLLPMTTDVAHLPLMAAVAFVMLTERYSEPRQLGLSLT